MNLPLVLALLWIAAVLGNPEQLRDRPALGPARVLLGGPRAG
jgi:hypothetical protein